MNSGGGNTSWRNPNSLRRSIGSESSSGRGNTSRRSRGWRGRPGGRDAKRVGRGGRNGSNLCWNFLETGECLSGVNCRYSHEIENQSQGGQSSRASRERPPETQEKLQAKADYRTWKQLIQRVPRENDIGGIRHLWSGALDILNDDDRDLKQLLPRDLDDEENFGKQHIRMLMSMEVRGNAHSTFIGLAVPFMSVITDRALLDCMSVDSAVGGIYSFISGTNGSRAIPFFQRLSASLLHDFLGLEDLESNPELSRGVYTLVRALDELLEREPKVAFHDDLPALMDSIEQMIEVTSLQDHLATNHGMDGMQSVRRLRGIIQRRTGMLQINNAEDAGITTSAASSTFPRNIIIPSNRHDNDRLDITDIRILPTEEEIRSNHPEFLPSTDFRQLHFIQDPAQRLLDTHFRLLRHDIFGQLKQALGGLMFGIENDPSVLSRSHHNFGDVQAYSYPKAWISYVSFGAKRGLEISITFPQPPPVAKKSSKERTKWWQESRRLEPGLLMCFISPHENKSSVLLLTVTDKETDGKGEFNLSTNDRQATIKAKFAGLNRRQDLERLMELSCKRSQGILIEFPGVMLATFVPILENLQRMQSQGRLPFSRWILPDMSSKPPQQLEIPPPIYSRNPGFRFSLKPILKNDEASDLCIDSQSRPDDNVLIDRLVAATQLDRGQCEALVAALVREYAFIQGPPGTGKSYLGVAIMRILLDCKMKANLGPVVVVCFTNHALDQFLEHLDNVGIDKIIRIGSQSKSATLEGKNLRVVSKGERTTKSEGYVKAQLYKRLEETEKRFRSHLGKMHGMQKEATWGNLKGYLMNHHRSIYGQFSEVDKDGFRRVGIPFDNWIRGVHKATSVSSEEHGTPVKSLEEILECAERDIYSLTNSEKRQLIVFWTEELRKDTTEQLVNLSYAADGAQHELDGVHNDVNRRVLETADVIGVTTSGLAKNIHILRHIQSKVVICEEAGEVLEAHMLSALLPSVEHFIQIGDHRQLRPKVNNFKELSLESHQGALYQLDRSQFERLSTNENGRTSFPVAQLNVQRRMRPAISTLIRETLYPRLIDHQDTKDLPNVVGIRENVFFLNHKNAEEAAKSDAYQKSRSNNWEVEMTHALVRHVVRQGVYTSEDIAVLTPYTGQLQKLRAKMRKEFEIVLSDRDQDELALGGFHEVENQGENQPVISKTPLQKKQMSDMLRLATVDNFQGEEAKIIIISLVRSNSEKRVGFLRTPNRINVLLSRAKHGMYLIGDAETYSNIPMWNMVIGMLQATESIGDALGLCCPQHPETEIAVSEPEDFHRLSPEGGCQRICDKRSQCGHRCKSRCHSDIMHLTFPCPQPCERTHKPCNHSCKKATCGEDCGPCLEKLDNITLPCGHLKNSVPCYKTQNLAKISCDTPTEKEVPACKHIVTVPCSRDVSVDNFKCLTPCKTILKCGDPCPGTCGQCSNSGNLEPDQVKHKNCARTCGRRFGTCNHTCSKKCHVGEDCGLCLLPCQVRCAHSKCQKSCREPCAPCIEKCTWSCEHKGACTMPCSAPCTRLPCNRRCGKSIRCGHQCPGVCGEECPHDYCQICSNKKDARVDLLEMRTYGEVDLNETPIVVLGCGHFFITESVDGLIGMNDVYIQDETGEFTGLKDISGELAESAPRCPDCNSSVRQYATQRYNRVVNRFVVDEMSKRFLVTGKEQLRLLEKKIDELEQLLETSREYVVGLITLGATRHTINSQISSTIESRLKESLDLTKKLQRGVKSFQRKAADENQPAQKLADATLHAARQRSILEKMNDLDLKDDMNNIPKLAKDRRVTFGGRGAQVKADFYILNDKLTIARALTSLPPENSIQMPGETPDKLAKLFFKVCHTFIQDCDQEKLPKMAVQASIYYASTARAYQSYSVAMNGGGNDSSTYVTLAKELLEKAKEMCNQPFENATALGKAVEDSLRMLGKEWYEPVNKEEIEAIKAAMVSGRGGIATHSGHWYNCVNGHPFAIGECGMAMERAECPECGAPVGGQNHQTVEGVTRAVQMEN